ncbi:MAG: long-chain fatty acid--CoA ligase, partial [Candidatus Krumholzibacteria bacterium]|nr:long-chain fatty acid--CoA ligase [Candidatus Krumholzibacteria bacterium]
MHTDFLRKVFVDLASDDAIIWNDQVHNYKWLTDRIDYWSNELSSAQIAPGTVVAIDGDYSPNGIALFLALIERSCVLVPLTSAVKAKHAEFIGVSQGEVTIAINDQ